jgi:hypothetical protein
MDATLTPRKLLLWQNHLHIGKDVCVLVKYMNLFCLCGLFPKRRGQTATPVDELKEHLSRVADLAMRLYAEGICQSVTYAPS